MIKGTDHISEQVYLLSMLQHKYIEKRLKEIELNEIQARALNYVAAYPGEIQTNLARYLGKPDATVTNILKQLEKKTYIRREIPTDNERQKRLYLTEEGDTAAAKLQRIFDDLEALMCEALNPKEVSALKASQKKLKEALNNI